MSAAAALLLPAIRWDVNHGFGAEQASIEKALAIGVGGFILFGGDQERVRALTKELRQKSRVPLLIAADLERGAGQQFSGATGLPPLAAIASLDDADAVRRAARLTAREARTLGLNWDLAPVCDLDIVPENPIVGTRSLGSDSRKVAMLAQAWMQACQAEGVLACAKHFPGHGRTLTDSHAGMPVVNATRAELMEHDLAPFRAAIEAGVAGVMTAHVSYPALDASGALRDDVARDVAVAAAPADALRWPDRDRCDDHAGRDRGARRSGSGDPRTRRRMRPPALSRRSRGSVGCDRSRGRDAPPGLRTHPGIAAQAAQVGAVVVAAERVPPSLGHGCACGARSSRTA